MYIYKSIIDGLKILGFDKETIKKVSREKSIEEIFLSTLFLNYIIILIVFILATIVGEISIGGRELNLPVFFGILMIYPFTFNLLVYGIYGLFGFIAEMIDSKKHIKPLIATGFHTAIVYGIIFYIIAILSTFNLEYAILLLITFIFYFIYTMFITISTVYEFSLEHTLITVFLPFILLGLVLLIIAMLFPEIIKSILIFFLV